MKEKIIIVFANDPIIIRFLKQQLFSLGYKNIISSMYEDEIFEILKSNKFDIILTDINSHSNFEIDFVKKVSKQFNLPVIFLTHNIKDDLNSKLMEIQSYEVISKPYSIRELNLNIELLLIKAEKQNTFKKNEKKYKELADLSPQFIFEIDKSGKFTYANQEFIEHSGYPKEAFNRELSIFSLIIEKDWNKLKENVKKVFETHMKVRGEYTAILKNGTLVNIMTHSAPIIESDNIMGLQGIAIDISKNKQIEEELKKVKEEIVKTNKSKSNFIANISHEIRTPMNSIIGFAELLSETNINKEQKDYVEMIKISATLLLDIINSVLDMSKIESGKLELDENLFSINGLINNIIKSLKFQSMKKKSLISYNISHDVIDLFYGDSSRIKQILLNLVSNALKFTENGIVKIFIENYTDNKENKYLKFLVLDNGIGIPANRLDGVFKQYEQTDESITRKYAGTGPGLNISKNLVEIMGGKIWVKSKEGEGSKFYFILPMKNHVETEITNNSKEINYRNAFEKVVQKNVLSNTNNNSLK